MNKNITIHVLNKIEPLLLPNAELINHVHIIHQRFFILYHVFFSSNLLPGTSFKLCIDRFVTNVLFDHGKSLYLFYWNY